MIAAVTAVDALEWLTAAEYCVLGAADCCSRNVGALAHARECNLRLCGAIRVRVDQCQVDHSGVEHVVFTRKLTFECCPSA